MPFVWKKDTFCIRPASVMLKLTHKPGTKTYIATCLSKECELTSDSLVLARLQAEQWLLEILRDVSSDLFCHINPLANTNG